MHHNTEHRPEADIIAQMLWRAETLGEMLNLILTRYKVKDLIVPAMFKAMIIQGLVFAVTILKPEQND
jgi:hypothetical protein